MSELDALEIKAFVPARDFELSKRFYEDLGFTLEWSSEDLAYLHFGDCAFLLQKFYVKEHADNFMMHLIVSDVDGWWRQVEDKRIASRYNVKAEPPEDRSWGLRDFILVDPTGILWRIGQDISDPDED